MLYDSTFHAKLIGVILMPKAESCKGYMVGAAAGAGI